MSTETSEKVISLSEINKHNKRDDLWVAINGKVYDVTKFIYEHPGGEEVLLDVAGKDATQDFEDVGHSEYAVDILKEHYIGEGDASELIIREKPLGVAEFHSSEETSGFNFLPVLLVVAIAGAVGVYLKFLK